MTIDYSGRVAVVTGAGAGLGRAHALLLARRGAKVVVNDLGGSVDGNAASSAAADAVVREIREAGGEAVAVYDSVATQAGGQAIVATAIDAFGRIDMLVNNAGNLRDKSFIKMDMEDFSAVIDTHLFGTAYCIAAAWPRMIEQRYGRIVVTTSASGLYGNFGQSNYAAAKAAVVGMMLSLKDEGAKYDVRVNAIAPVAATRMTADILPEGTPELFSPELVSPAVGWFCAEECTESGTVIEAGGGYFARVQTFESGGVVLAPDGVEPEDIRDNWAAISDMANARPFANSMGVIGKVLKDITA
ncbi:MAG: hypothetical protein CMN73_11015 [Sphingomonas sp.]|nr:hypothetical protein [Sphingomonas sp.]|tara:strand:- start:882 stop:1784 length:903 start_codon:yes stop_codon:yes gene_type:complete